MGKRVRITNSSLNDLGTRVLTSGVDIGQYRRNPVLLYMHQRGEVIGLVKDIRVEGDEITGELEFDGASEMSVRAERQFGFGSLRMVSAGLDIIETSEDPTLLVPGQTRPTVTRSRLFEVSVVDIGSNDDAIVLRKDGVALTLAKDGECALPLLNNKQTSLKKKEMNQEEITALLGLEASADDNAVRARVTELLASSREAETLRSERETLRLAAITQAVENGIAERRVPADRREHFIGLGKSVGLDALKTTIQAMSPAVKVSGMIRGGEGQAEFGKLSEVPADRIEAMRRDDRQNYIRLYKAEYGFEPKFDED